MPKAVSTITQKRPIFRNLRFNEMAATCWSLLSPVEAGGFEQLQNYLQPQISDSVYSV